MNIPLCHWCLTPVRWCNTVDGEQICVDHYPSAGGTLRVTGGDAHHVGATIDLFDPDDHGIRHTEHVCDGRR